MNVLDVENVSASHNGSLAINKISFSVREGDLLGIVGPNGAGKTTLFRAILGLQQYQGKIKLFGYEGNQYESLLPMVGYVPQKVNFESNFPATVYDVVEMGLLPEKKLKKGAALIQNCGCSWNRIFGASSKNSEKIETVLEIVGLDLLRNRRISELSGGEQQRTFIASALVKEPVLLILDEPVTGVDMEVQNKFYSVLRKINKENKITIIWASHDLTAISDHATKVACMNRDLFFHGEKDEFFSNKDLLKTYSESAMQMHMHNHNHNHSHKV
ncbi:MAG: metal ABC transporter ATP-binding protein [Thaumarchaeota archaeon]|nr:metal ABC transporter ATP-binding protein [Nitrososphaerota archaeon]